MENTYGLILSGMLILIGVGGVLLRRNLMMIAVSLEISFLGVTLGFATLSISQINPSSTIIGVFLLIMFALHAGMVSALAIFIYRHLGTLNVDELRQLRG